jgi:hypothetical protein
LPRRHAAAARVKQPWSSDILYISSEPNLETLSILVRHNPSIHYNHTMPSRSSTPPRRDAGSRSPYSRASRSPSRSPRRSISPRPSPSPQRRSPSRTRSPAHSRSRSRSYRARSTSRGRDRSPSPPMPRSSKVRQCFLLFSLRKAANTTLADCH